MRDMSGPEGPELTGTAGSFRIMVAEDEGIIAKDLERRLTKQGYSVAAVVASGEDAIRRAQETLPDLILMDIVLNGDIDGIDAAAEIRRRLDVPVIYLTAYADDKILQRAKLTEPYGYIIKPFDDRSLCSAIEMSLYKHTMERKVRESEEWLSTILRSIGDGVIASNAGGSVIFMNTVAEKLTGWTFDEARGSHISEIFRIVNGHERASCLDTWATIMETGATTSLSHDCTLTAKDGTERVIGDSGAPIRGRHGGILGIVLVFRDVTEQRKMDLALRESEQKLRMHAHELEESNTALKVLLKQRENDRKELEENILANVKQLILPYLEKLKKNKAMSEELAYLNIVERNLKEIISPFSIRLSSKYYALTPREIMIAELIKEGKQDKDIMDVLNISFETVKSHRQNIRKKLGIYAKRTNLRAHLLMLSE
ncbi:MAG: response regulator [Thermodesulfovibrionales bacterium]